MIEIGPRRRRGCLLSAPPWIHQWHPQNRYPSNIMSLQSHQHVTISTLLKSLQKMAPPAHDQRVLQNHNLVKTIRQKSSAADFLP